MTKKAIEARFEFWTKQLRLKNQWDITLKWINDESFNKTGDFKVDPDDKKAIVFLNVNNPHNHNLEEVIVHELMHLKMYPLDQLTENLIEVNYGNESKAYDLAYAQFMICLEQTVAELTKCYLLKHGVDKSLGYGRVKSKKGFNALYEDLKPYGNDW